MHTRMYTHMLLHAKVVVQWNLSNPVTYGP